jgi:transcriptional regulator with XRE-family HTH domain
MIYPTDLINAAMGAQRLTNEQVAAKATLSPKVVSAIRNGRENIRLPSLKKVADALNLDLIVKLKKKAA